MGKKILHIGGYDKFTKPFIEFVRENFVFDDHFFLMISKEKENASHANVKSARRTVFSRLKHYAEAVWRMHQAKIIVLHGLSDRKLTFILFFMPWVLKKCYWVIWGADLYSYQLGSRNLTWKVKEFFRRPVIKNMGHLVTYIDGDVTLARKWYGAKGIHHECFMYLSNVVNPDAISTTHPQHNESGLNILLGNSANPSNNHIEAMKHLLPYKDQNIKIFVPLSYGDKEHANMVISKGREWFGEKLVPLTEFMAFNQYLEFLKSLDIAIFNHQRQQAMGNIITLLGMGKTVFIRSDVSQWDLFEKVGVEVFDINQFELVLMGSHPAWRNVEKIKNKFSREKLIDQYWEIFEN